MCGAINGFDGFVENKKKPSHSSVLPSIAMHRGGPNKIRRRQMKGRVRSMQGDRGRCVQCKENMSISPDYFHSNLLGFIVSFHHNNRKTVEAMRAERSESSVFAECRIGGVDGKQLGARPPENEAFTAYGECVCVCASRCICFECCARLRKQWKEYYFRSGKWATKADLG